MGGIRSALCIAGVMLMVMAFVALLTWTFRGAATDVPTSLVLVITATVAALVISLLRDVGPLAGPSYASRNSPRDRLALAVEAHAAGFHEYGKADEVGFFHRPLWAEVLGFEAHELPDGPRFVDWLADRVAPEDRERLSETYSRFGSGESTDYFLDVKARHRQGNWLRLRCRGQAVGRTESGQVSQVIGVILDVTAEALLEEELSRQVSARTAELRDVNQKLRASEERYRIISELISDYAYCFRYAPNGGFRREWEAGAFTAITGYRTEELDEHGWQRLSLPDDQAVILQRAEAIRAGREASFDFRIVTKAGEIRWVRDSIRSVALAEPSGGSLVYGAAYDITAEKTAEEQLREQGTRLAGIINNATDAIISIDIKGKIESFNPAAESIFGYAAEEVLGRNVNILMPSPHRERHDSYIQRYLDTGVKQIIGIGREVDGRRKDGSTFPLELAVTEMSSRTGNRFTGILRDITLRRNLEKRVLEIVTEEQRKIGQDLHDVVGQEVLGVSLLSERLAGLLIGKHPEDAALAAKIAAQLRQTLATVRNLSRGLVPVEVDADGLMASLQTLADQTTSLGSVNCQFDCPKPVPMLNNALATHLYRIAQEAVSNALKHSRASKVDISLGRTEEGTMLVIRDNGTGIALEEVGRSGMGLHLMQYRAGLIGGRLIVRSPGAGGTVVKCVLPEESTHES